MPSLSLQKKYNGQVLAIVEGGRSHGMFLTVQDTPGPSRIDLDSGHFVQEPNHDPDARLVATYQGPSGSGKSTVILGVCSRYHKLFPSRPIVILSRLSDPDDALSQDWIHRIRLDSLKEKQFDLSEFHNGGCVIVDDVDGVDSETDKKIQELITLIASQGRHYRISLLWSSHNLTNFSKTRLILQEAMSYCIFPHASSFHQIRYLLSSYCGMDKKEISLIRKLPSRWAICTRRYPPCVFSENQAFLIHALE